MSAFLNVVGVGNSLEWLKQVPSNSVDSSVTDPPYGLGEPPPIAAVVLAWARGKDYVPEGTGFMGKEWDAFVPNPSIWREVYRILKPGAWLLAFFGSRTYDLGVLSIRFAGFEVADGMMWLYGSGFPKSLDIAKALDKEAGHWRGRAGAVTSENRSMAAANYERTEKGKAITDEAKEWEGWGTALKPAYEPIVVARKPFGGTYVENLRKHGTGALNIDAARVGTSGGTAGFDYPKTGLFGIGGSGTIVQLDAGRWPANVVLQHDPRCQLRGTKTVGSGDKKVGGVPRSNVGHKLSATSADRSEAVVNYGAEDVEDWLCVADCPAKMLDAQSGTGDIGGASRFFYTPKAAVKERWSYCSQCKLVFQHAEENFEEHEVHKAKVISHPTQKPLDLMRYLVRLVTRPGGTVVDPFCGTGSTPTAAREGGFNFITADLDENYAKIASARVATAHLGGARVGSSYFCPGCKAKGEAKLIERSVVERMKADGKKTTCVKCLGRFSCEELVSG